MTVDYQNKINETLQRRSSQEIIDESRGFRDQEEAEWIDRLERYEKNKYYNDYWLHDWARYEHYTYYCTVFLPVHFYVLEKEGKLSFGEKEIEIDGEKYLFKGQVNAENLATGIGTAN